MVAALALTAAAPASQSGSSKGGGRGGSIGNTRPRAETSGAAQPKKKAGRKANKEGEDDDPIEATQQGGAAAASAMDTGPKPKESLASVKTAKILKAIVKGLLRAMQDNRDLMSCCIDVLIGPESDSIFAQMSTQTSEYSKLSKAEKESHGSPHLLAFVGLLEAIIAKGPVVGQANFEAISAYNEQVKGYTPTQLNDHVRLCKQAKGYKAENKKLYLEMGRCPVRSEILAAAIQAGFQLKGGRAPPSHLERDLVEWLQQL
jgi:hypothetical protein